MLTVGCCDRYYPTMNTQFEVAAGRTTKATSAPTRTSKSKLLLPLILSVLTLLLAACGWQGAGTVVSKEKSDGYWYNSSYCAAYDGKGMCTMTMQQVNYMPDTYSVKVKDESGEVHEVDVNQSYWDAAKEGDHFDNTDKK